MGNVLRMSKQQQIQSLIALKWSDRRISREAGFDRKTVARYRHKAMCAELATCADRVEKGPEVPTDPVEPNAPEVPTELPAPPRTNSIQIQPHAATIRTKFLQHLSAQRIYQDLVEEDGYAGSYDAVKRYVRKLRRKHRRYAERLEHPAGREMQVDFGKSPCFVRINGRYHRPWFFKATLSCSKHSYEELVERQDVETFIRCHERAFAHFGGVTEVVTLDNLKSGVLHAHMYEPEINPTYLAFANHWGFAANPCIAYKPEHKGVVERDVGYTKHNGLKGLRFETLADGNLHLWKWNKRWARTRIHGSTKMQVFRMFCDIERTMLRPLADTPFSYFHVLKRKVDVNGLVEVDARFYAAPHQYVGEQVVVHHNSEWVKILKDEKLLIHHKRLPQRGRISRPVTCCPPWKHPQQESQERYYCRKARDVGPQFYALVYATLCTDDPLAIRRCRGLLSLARRFPSGTVEEAAGRARRRATPRYHHVKELCERIAAGEGQQPDRPLTQQHDLIRPLSDYATLIEERTA